MKALSWSVSAASFTVLCVVWSTSADENQDRIVTSLKKQGATITIDEKDALKPATKALLKGKTATDKVFEDLKQLPKLRSLAIEGTLITDRGFAGLATFAELQALDLSDALITNEGLKPLFG